MATIAAKKKTVASSATKTDDSPPFEEAMARLEGIANRLERNDLTLSEALLCFEEGVGLMRLCDGHLKNANGKLMELVKSDNDNSFITKILGESLESFIGGENIDG